MVLKNAFQPMIGEELKAWRQKLGLSQEGMAKKLRISVRSYIELEHGTNGISAVTLVFFLTLLAPEEQMRILQVMQNMVP